MSDAPQTTEDTLRMALNLARNCGYPVFPCNWANKAPTRPKREGGDGYQDATTDPEKIAWLWANWPGLLVGVATGSRSGISLLDIDVKHDTARAWWFQNEHRVPETRINRSRSGGLHVVLQHVPGARNAEGRPVPGVDARGEGGYMIWWPAAGCEVLDPVAPAPWPDWLSKFFWPPPKPRPFGRPTTLSDKEMQRIRDRAIDMVRSSQDGQKHHQLRGAARLLGGIQHRVGFTDAEAESWLISVLPPGVRDEQNARRTVHWGLASGRAQPIDTRSSK